jgi:hypothetical protein
MRRRAALEAVIGHLKAEHRMGRNHLKERHSDGINAVPAAAGSTSVRSWLAHGGLASLHPGAACHPLATRNLLKDVP